MYRVLKPKTPKYSREEKEMVLKACQERVSWRGMERVFGVCRQTIAGWVKDRVGRLPMLAETLVDYQVGDVLEIDEMWSFVLNKTRKRWIWLALCRRTRQIVAFYIGKRDTHAAQQLWQRVEYPYTLCPLYTDHYEAYSVALPDDQHWAKDKASGATAHIERWNNTLRQRLARFVRKTLAFSKSDLMHRLMLEWFVIEYNRQIASLTT